MDAVCYGFKHFGQICSDDFETVSSQFKLPESVEFIKWIAFGWSRCYVVLESGAVFLQGFFDSQARKRKKLELPFQSVIKKITCLRRYDLFLTEDGSCWKCANSQWIKLDHLISNELRKPDFKIVDVVSSDELHLALSNEGLLFSFPLLVDMPPYPAKVIKACCGLEHYLCLLDNGSVFVWGSGSRGQLGNGVLNAVEQPQLLIPLDGLVVTDIDAGGWHSAAITTSGDLYTWGWNNSGQLGIYCGKDSTEENDDHCITVISEPQLVTCFDNVDASFQQVACGTNHMLVLMDDGLVWGCGSNKYGQINPTLKQQCFYQMTRVPLPEKTDSVKRIHCASWNSIIYLSVKK